jgi:hypothetical protein
MGQFVKIGFPCHILIVRSGLGSYVRRITTSRMSGKIPYVRYVGSQGKPYFLSIVCLFSDS